jgi:hypothetical protein
MPTLPQFKIKSIAELQAHDPLILVNLFCLASFDDNHQRL